MIVSFLFFFFKQKTAYEMRISDWSSDVCSSDLPRIFRIVDVRIERAAHIIPPRMFGAVRRQAEMHALGMRRLGDLADHVALRPHVGGVPDGTVRIVHREAVALLGDRAAVFRAGVGEEFTPGGDWKKRRGG